MCGLSCLADVYLMMMTNVTLQAIRDEEVQYCEAYESRFGGVEVKTDKVKKEEKKKKGKQPYSEIIIFIWLLCKL